MTIVSINVQNVNGLRFGTLKVDDYFIEQFPKQAITSTNINHLDVLNLGESALGTEITEILLEPARITAEAIDEKISSNGLNLLMAILPAGEQLSFDQVRDIIQAQKDSNLKVIRVFLTPNIRIQQAKELISLAAKNKTAMPVFDMHMDITKLIALYEHCLEIGIKLVGFISRGFNSETEALIMSYIRDRPNDAVIRHVSWINPRTRLERDYIRSFVYYVFGFDLFSFQTKIGRQDAPIERIVQLDRGQMIYVPIIDVGVCGCVVHTGRSCELVARSYERQRKATVPSSAHTLRTINDVCIDIYTSLARREDPRAYFETDEVKDAVELVQSMI
ncbi:hypothetical protein HYU11_03030 [Candidatus Woesearchaeota archaeon]|nr:hypothetical protein [Candidatus Woesearchaeota archaeon]